MKTVKRCLRIAYMGLTGAIVLMSYFANAGPLNINDEQFVLQRLMIAKIRQYNGDSSAGMLLKELRQEAGEHGIKLPAWAEKKSDKKFISCIRMTKHGQNNQFYLYHSNINKYDNLIMKASQIYCLSPALIKAVIKVESGFIKDAVSHVGAQGLMQIMPDTAADLNIVDVFNPEINILGGTRLLRKYLDEFGSLKRALIAYNSGPDRVRQGKVVPIETRKYIKKVVYYYNIYKKNI